MFNTCLARSDSKKVCMICGRHGHEDESCATLPITFSWKHDAHSVFIVGSFNQWQVKHKLQRLSKDEPFKIEICLAPGTYQYKYIVDGAWAEDPDEPTMLDEKNELNNTIEVKPANFTEDDDSDQEEYLICITNKADPHCEYKIKKITYEFPATWVSIKGSWDDWKEEIPLKRFKNNFNGSSEFYVTVKIAPGTYQFKLLVNGKWELSNSHPTVEEGEHENNILLVTKFSSLACPKPETLEEKIFLNWRREETRWTECGTIHHTLQGHSLSVICNMIYVFGGLANGKFTNTLYTYDPKINEFQLVEDQSGDIPDPRAFHNATVFGSKILIYGGFNKEYLTDYHSFNTLTKVWTRAEIDGDGPCPRERGSLVPYIEDKLILFGGYYCSPDMEVEKYFNDLYVLNLSLMEWIQPDIEGECPEPRSAHTANFVKGRMYIFGGVTTQQKKLNDIWMLKPTPTGPLHWKKISPKGAPPETRHGHSAAVANTNIIYFGGRGNGNKKHFDDLFMFDTIGEAWVYPKVDGIRPTPRYYHASAALNGGSEIVIFGGVRPKEFLHYPRMYILETNTKAHLHFQEISEEEENGKAESP